VWQAITRADPVMSLDEWAQIFSAFSYNGLQYPFMPFQTVNGQKEEIGAGFMGFVTAAYRANGIVFACIMTRMLAFSEARFQFRRMNNGRPGALFGTSELGVLETPWSGAATGDLLSRCILDADLAGNSFTVRHVNPVTKKPELKRLRPDWVTVVAGAPNDPEIMGWDINAQLLGYIYHPPVAGQQPKMFLPEEVCHFAPIPDPLFNYRGMPWLEPVLREVMADGAATSHKLKFFENAATPNMVVTLDPTIGKELFDRWIEAFESKHQGLLNAYKTLYLGGGATSTVVGSTLRQMDFKVTQGAGETRIAAAAGVPPIIVGLSEGLASATYSNYGLAMRRFADLTMRPLWRNFAGSMERIINVPGGADLWYDDRDVPWLKDDVTAMATRQETQSKAILNLVSAGYTPDSTVSAVEADDWTLLEHSGLYSTKLQPPGEMGEPGGPVPGEAPPPPLIPNVPKPAKTGEVNPQTGQPMPTNPPVATPAPAGAPGSNP
jgi:phage portal protein BeeE